MVFFIVGSGRSGTTLMAQMLNAHSSICVPHELQLLFEYSNNGPRLLEVFQSGQNQRYGPEDFIELVRERCPHRFEAYFDYPTFFRSQQYPLTDLRQLVTDLFQAIAQSRQKPIFGEQTPWYGQRIDVLQSLFPDARYIHMVRDGRDVALSFARTPWWHDDPLLNLTRWDHEVRVIEAHERMLPSGQSLTVRYEDLVDQPQAQLARVCEHLGVRPEPAMLEGSSYLDYSQYSKTDTRKISSSSLNDWKANRQGATFKGSRLAWKNSDVFKDLRLQGPAAQTLHRHGYEVPTGSWMHRLKARLKRAIPD